MKPQQFTGTNVIKDLDALDVGLTPEEALVLEHGPAKYASDLNIIVHSLARYEVPERIARTEKASRHAPVMTPQTESAEGEQTDSQSASPIPVNFREAAEAVQQSHAHRSEAARFEVVKQTWLGMLRVEEQIPDDLAKLANELGLVVMPSHRGIECRRGEALQFTESSIEKMTNTLLHMRMQQIEAMFK